MSSYEYLIRRTALSIPVLFGVSMLIFTITRVIPGDPVRLALGPSASEETIRRLSVELGLDKPIYLQYLDWITGVFQGQWGQSLRTNNDVFQDIVTRLPATLELSMVALLIAVTLGVPFGVIAGTHKDRWEDHLSRVAALTGVSMPRFWVAILFQVVFVATLGVLPLTGRLSNGVTPPPAVTHFYLVDSLIAGQWSVFVDAVQHIVLPATALSVATLAQVMRLIRSDMIEEQSKNYILAVRAYGLPLNLIRYKYMLKNAFSSALTMIGLAFGSLIANAFLVETVFAWPGMARYGVNAIIAQDFNAVVGVTMVVAIAYVFANIVVDVLYGSLDPRVRLKQGD